jgi:hypothetical protein
LDGGQELPHVDCAAFSPDGKATAVGGGKYDDGVLHVWSGASFKEKRRWQLEGGQVGFIAFSPKGDLVACASERFPQGGFGGVCVGGLEVCEYPGGKRLPFKLRTKLQY